MNSKIHGIFRTLVLIVLFPIWISCIVVGTALFCLLLVPVLLMLTFEWAWTGKWNSILWQIYKPYLFGKE